MCISGSVWGDGELIGTPVDPVKLDSKARFYRGMMCHREQSPQETPWVVEALAHGRRFGVASKSLQKLQNCRWMGEDHLHRLRHSDEYKRHPNRTSVDLQKVARELVRIDHAIADLLNKRVAVAVA